MQLYDLSDSQLSDLSSLYPGVPPTQYAVASEAEYLLWRATFQKLQKAFFTYFTIPSHVEHALRTLPIMQWVAKLVRPEKISGLNVDPGVLLPKAFKVGFLGEGTCRDFGYNQLMISLLDVLAGSADLPTISWEPWQRDTNVDYLGFLAWHQNPQTGERYLPLFMPCSKNVKEIKIIDYENAAEGEPKSLIEYRGERYNALVTTNLYLPDYDYQDILKKLQERNILITPHDFSPANPRKWIDFRHPAWATLYPLDFFLGRVRTEPEFDDYMLVRVDEGSVPYRWSDVQKDAMLQLELEMAEFWVWQERCDSPFNDLTMYWTPCLKYPWLINRTAEEWIPVLVTAEEQR